jgi:hypothetical protein
MDACFRDLQKDRASDWDPVLLVLEAEPVFRWRLWSVIVGEWVMVPWSESRALKLACVTVGEGEIVASKGSVHGGIEMVSGRGRSDACVSEPTVVEAFD